jgi:hypothetical protein
VILFLNIGGCIISLLDHHHLRRFAISLDDMYFSMCILVMQTGVMLKPLK